MASACWPAQASSRACRTAAAAANGGAAARDPLAALLRLVLAIACPTPPLMPRNEAPSLAAEDVARGAPRPASVAAVRRNRRYRPAGRRSIDLRCDAPADVARAAVDDDRVQLRRQVAIER